MSATTKEIDDKLAELLGRPVTEAEREAILAGVGRLLDLAPVLLRIAEALFEIGRICQGERPNDDLDAGSWGVDRQ